MLLVCPGYMEDPHYTGPLSVSAFLAVLGSFNCGYNAGVLNVPEAVIRGDLDIGELGWSVVVSIFCLGGLIGSSVSGSACDYLGRKRLILLNNGIFILGALLLVLAQSTFQLIMGRMCMGMACGVSSVVVPLYLGEIAPAQLRGALGVAHQLFLCVGLVVAVLLGKPLNLSSPGWTLQGWRLLLAWTLVPVVLQLFFQGAMVESPRWLNSIGREQAAEHVLQKLRGYDDVRFDMICMGGPSVKHNEAAEPHIAPSVFSLIANKKFRLPLTIALMLPVIQQFSGINGVFYYSTSFFTKANIDDPWLVSVVFVCICLMRHC